MRACSPGITMKNSQAEADILQRVFHGDAPEAGSGEYTERDYAPVPRCLPVGHGTIDARHPESIHFGLLLARQF